MSEPTQPPPIDYATPQPKRRWSALNAIVVFVLLCTLIYILIPGRNSRRGDHSRGRCASNMEQIGTAFMLYANENRGHYPPDLATTVLTQDLTLDVIVCWANPVSQMATTRFTSDPAARAASNLDYIYVGEGLKSTAPADEVLLFERLSNHDHTGGNILFGDGHVEFINKPELLKLLDPLKGTPRLTQEEYDAITAR